MYADTAGEREVIAGDVAGGVRGEEGHRFGDVGRSADAAQRDVPCPGVRSRPRALLEERERPRAVLATAFACLDAASMTWVAGDGQSTIMDLYDECLTAVRG